MSDRIALSLAALLGAALFLIAGTAHSAEVDQRVALVIGNSAYKESPLANPGNDAADMAKKLEEMGFKVILRRNVNTRAMREAIREFGKELRRAQVGLFFYAGHGVQIRGSNYLVPVGADIQAEADVEDQAIDANYVLRTMDDAQVKVNIVILDACRNNPYASSFRSTSTGLAQMRAATGTLIAFSTAPGSIAADGSGRNGLYTQHLLASLDQPDTDISKVFQRTRAAVVKETGGKQTPWESTSLVGDFSFKPPAAKPAPVATAAPGAAGDGADANERVFWDSVKDSRNPIELNAYLVKFPNGLFAELARTRLQALGQTDVATASNGLARAIQPGTALGCYKDQGDTGGLTGRDMNGLVQSSRGMTTEMCIEFCASRNFPYAGTQYGTQCFCSTSYGKSGPATNCNMPCSGNDKQTCGGGWANSVYRTSAGAGN